MLFKRPPWPCLAPPERHLLVNLRSMPSPRTKEVPRNSDFFSQKWAPFHQAPSTSRYLSRAEPLVCCHPGAAFVWETAAQGGKKSVPFEPGVIAEHTSTRQRREGGLPEEWILVTKVGKLLDPIICYQTRELAWCYSKLQSSCTN